MESLDYIELDSSKVSDTVIAEFDCGNDDMTEYLHEYAKEYGIRGKGVTYILTDNERSRIYAYATIIANGLYYYTDAEEHHTKSTTGDGKILFSIPCIEIKMFAISKKLKGQVAYLMDPERKRHYSTLFFNMLLEKLYYMSMSVLGFQMIFLRANIEGERLYRKSGFVEADEFLDSYDAKSENCTSLVLNVADIESIIFT